ncbi:hypothetical protein AUJ17_03880 [Candidatus Micrarchaeota archaeon CG1_02_47_40]|nr:MAG: hypothetical protein AUJ17_03880 [Candidatus Micrarchaeota archaeon CG1_02_47_40]
MDTQFILRQGKAVFRVNRAGMYQRMTFLVKYEEMPEGKSPYLLSEKFLEPAEAMKVCAQSGLPVFTKNGRFFPAGKGMADFIIKQ